MFVANATKRSIMKNILFEGIEEESVKKLLKCFNAYEQSYSRGSYILHSGDNISSLYLVLKGGLNAQAFDIYGNVNLISHIPEGGLFGGAFAFSDEAPCPDLVSAEDSRILVLPIDKGLCPCERKCDTHMQFYSNLIKLLARRSASLITKINHLSQRSIREKLLSYLKTEEIKQGGGYIKLHFDRQQLADYLCVDRASLSRELSKMKEDGIIDYNKNTFKLLV